METSFRDGVATVRFDDGKANALDAGWFTRLDAALDDAVLDNGEAASSSSVGGIKFPNLPLDKLAKAVADNVESPSPSSEEAKEGEAKAVEERRNECSS